jgi:hypothetical protein
VLKYRRLALGALLASCAPHGGAAKTELRGEDCNLCHTDEVRETKSPPHAQAGFPQDCGSCHDEQSWRPAPGFAHVESFPLTLGHEGPGCASCHQSGYEAGKIQNECVDCHSARAAAVVDPTHQGLSTSCFACHRTDSFFPARFVHSWPLEGKHTLTSCGSCHGNNPARYEGTDSACLNCHADDRARADANSSAHRGYDDDCASCHEFDAF